MGRRQHAAVGCADGKVFNKYEPSDWEAIATDLRALVPGHEVTPVDFGDVCINYDITWFTTNNVAPPTTLDDLLKQEYKDLLVVENPSTSSPGLAFLLATIAHSGEDGWQEYWKGLRANGVEVVDGWTTAYEDEFSGAAASTGKRPLVVSYGSSPPAEVIFADPPAPMHRRPSSSRHASVRWSSPACCAAPNTRRRHASWSTSWSVRPSRTNCAQPVRVPGPCRRLAAPEFTKFAVVPTEPLTMDPAVIAANRQQWQDEWTNIVLRCIARPGGSSPPSPSHRHCSSQSCTCGRSPRSFRRPCNTARPKARSSVT